MDVVVKRVLGAFLLIKLDLTAIHLVKKRGIRSIAQTWHKVEDLHGVLVVLVIQIIRDVRDINRRLSLLNSGKGRLAILQITFSDKSVRRASL
jgi:hypothetical protein